jgi:hypothetical protein
MVPLLLLIAGLLGWALWAGRITLAQLPPLLLAVSGAFIAARGQWLFGLGVIGVGIVWYVGQARRITGAHRTQSQLQAIDNARRLLGVVAQDDAERIKARHRILITQNHPDTGGDPKTAQQLNDARDLLLHDLARKTL